MLRRLLCIFLLVGITGCSVRSGGAGDPCLHRNGDCFDAAINGRKIVPLRSSLTGYESYLNASGKADLKQTRWEIEAPVDGDIALEVAFNEKTGGWFGPTAQAELMVMPLQPTALNVRTGIRQANNVNVEGRPLMVQENVLTDSRLPPGKYIFIITLRGPQNWDRKHIFAIVK
jgi:hypothetical protein